MGARSGNVLVGPRDTATVEFCPWPHIDTAFELVSLHSGQGQSIVGVIGARIPPVRIAVPHVMGAVVITVDVIPARVDEHPIVVDAWMKLVGLMKIYRVQITAILLHRVHGETWNRSSVTSAESTPPCAHEYDPAVRHPAGIKIVKEGICQACQA